MSEMELKDDIEAEDFADELSDEALDRNEQADKAGHTMAYCPTNCR